MFARLCLFAVLATAALSHYEDSWEEAHPATRAPQLAQAPPAHATRAPRLADEYALEQVLHAHNKKLGLDREIQGRSLDAKIDMYIQDRLEFAQDLDQVQFWSRRRRRRWFKVPDMSKMLEPIFKKATAALMDTATLKAEGSAAGQSACAELVVPKAVAGHAKPILESLVGKFKDQIPEQFQPALEEAKVSHGSCSGNVIKEINGHELWKVANSKYHIAGKIERIAKKIRAQKLVSNYLTNDLPKVLGKYHVKITQG
jgi:hypothetical protein